MSDIILPSERFLNRQAVRAGQMFVLVDTSVPGGKWIDEVLYPSASEADREAAKLKGRYPKVQVIDATWYAPADKKLRALGMKAAADKIALNAGTVEAFLQVASSKLTQYDARLQKRQPNMYRLGHYLGALQKVRSDVSGLLNDDSPEALGQLKASLLRRFTSRGGKSDLAPIRNVIKQIDAFQASGQLPSLTRRASKGTGPRFQLPGKRAGTHIAFGQDRLFGRWFQYGQTRDEPSVDEDRLNQGEIVALLKQYGKPSVELDKAAGAFMMDQDPSNAGLRSIEGSDDLLPYERARLARFSEGPEGEKEWKAWFASQPESFQEEWKAEKAKHEDKFTGGEAMTSLPYEEACGTPMGGEACGEPMEEAMMEKTDDAVLLPVEVEMKRLALEKAARLTMDDMRELDPKGELDEDGLSKLLRTLQSGSNPERALSLADRLLRTHGVETVDLDEEDYSSDPFASYLNTGDMYNVTLAWVYPRRQWEITTLGDLREEAERGRFASTKTAGAPSGLYGFTKGTQSDVEVTLRKAKKAARRLAKSLHASDARSIPFLQTHAKRARSISARLLLSAMKDNGLRVASSTRQAMDPDQAAVYNDLWDRAASDLEARAAGDADAAVERAYTASLQDSEGGARATFRALRPILAADLADFWKEPRVASDKTGGIGLYGHPTKTARQCLAACTELRAVVGEIAYDLHSRRTARWDRLTGFMKQHAKTAKCRYTRMLLGCYPDNPTASPVKRASADWWDVDTREAGKLPDALKKHQFGPGGSKGDKKKDDDKGEKKKDDDKGEKKDDKKKDDGKMPADLLDKFKGKKAAEVDAAKKAPPKEHQFTSEDNPNPKGNDKDGDGETGEEKPFKEAAIDVGSPAHIEALHNGIKDVKSQVKRQEQAVKDLSDIASPLGPKAVAIYVRKEKAHLEDRKELLKALEKELKDAQSKKAAVSAKDIKPGDTVMVGKYKGRVERVRSVDAWVELDHGASWVPLKNITLPGKKGSEDPLVAAWGPLLHTAADVPTVPINWNGVKAVQYKRGRWGVLMDSGLLNSYTDPQKFLYQLKNSFQVPSRQAERAFKQLKEMVGAGKKADFDPNEIGATEPGSLVYETDEVDYMGNNFTEQETDELSDVQESGKLAADDQGTLEWLE